MADLESVLQDVSYLMAIEKSRGSGSRTIKKFVLPDKSVHCVVHKYLEEVGQASLKSIYSQRFGIHFMSKHIPGDCLTFTGVKAISAYERLSSREMRAKKAKEIFDRFLYAEQLAMNTDVAVPKEVITQIGDVISRGQHPSGLFDKAKTLMFKWLQDNYGPQFYHSDPYIRFCQWKYMEYLTPQLITLGDFSIHRIIGRGGFGEVFGCRKDDSGKMFAMKLLDKKRIKLKKGEALALNEKNILAKVNSPFVVNLYYAFQTADKLCFILDLMNGGDLHYHLTQHGVFTEDEVRFYAAELILSLEHIHSQTIVYRDLKPSNILLDEVGHVRLSDLGLACEFKDREPSSSVGTHGYMAPEVIRKGVQYTSSADWFSLGCVLYKLLKGHSPFRSGNAKQKDDIDKQTLEKEASFPSSMSESLKQLLGGLLEKDPGKRLGCGGRGSEEIKELPFFATLNWDDVLDKKLTPPLVPPRGEVNAQDAFDIGSFDDEDTRSVRLEESDQKLYKRFNILVPDRWQAEMIEGIFDSVNNETDKREGSKDKMKLRKSSVQYTPNVAQSDIVLQGYAYKLGSTIFSKWERKYFVLYPNRLQWADSIAAQHKSQVLGFDTPVLAEDKMQKSNRMIRLQPIGGRKEYCIRFDADFEHELWMSYIRKMVVQSQSLLTAGPKTMMDATASNSLMPAMGGRRRPLAITKSLPAMLDDKI